MIPPGTLLGGVQAQLRGSAVLGQVDPEGRQIGLGKLEGWWDPVAVTSSTVQKANDLGAWLGPSYYGPRIITVEARIDGFNPGDSMAAARRLLSYLTPDQLGEFRVTDETGETLVADVRQEADPVLLRQGNRVTVSLLLIAPDPRRYTRTSLSATTGLPTTSGGLVLPTTLPFALAGTVDSGSVTVVNTGDMPTDPIITATGPVAPFVVNDSSGNQLFYPEAVPAGRRVILHAGARTALLDNVAVRTVTGTWPVIAPGSNEIRFNSSSYNSASQFRVAYRSAWR